MKLIHSQKRANAGRHFIFQINDREKELLLAVLQLYPQLDASCHQLSRNPKTTGSAEQQWLEQSMELQRQDHKKKLGLFFGNARRFLKESEGEFRFSLTGEQMEWLLRVLNEIRVGAWVRLGRPEMDAARKLHLTGVKARLFSAMELSGYFQSNLLSAFS